MENLYIIWSLLALLCVIGELVYPGLFYFLSLASGAFMAQIAYSLDASPFIQVISWILGTAISLFLLRLWVKSKGLKALHKTNVFALVGQHAIVVEPLTAQQKGWILVHGELWAARAQKDEVVEKNENVLVIDIKGSHLIVRKI